jgi:hypothetical protein
MPVPVVQSLIDKVDNLRVVRDQIATILLTNSARQQELAQAAIKDPAPWKVRVFVDRTDCTGEFTSHDEEEDKPRDLPIPIVSVLVEESSYDRARSAPVGRQQADGKYYLDIYAGGISTDTSDGHMPADQMAAEELLRVYGLVRNILVSDICQNLGMLGVVGDHWCESFKVMQLRAADRDKPNVDHVAVGRLELSVSFLEYAPAYEGTLIEAITGTVKRTETGEIYFKTTPPLGV